MSKIGNKPIEIPEGVTVEVGESLTVKGPKGELQRRIPEEISAELRDKKLVVARSADTKRAKSLHGLYRSLIANMVEGVSKGFEIVLELFGIGYRASVSDNKLILNIGYSHPVEIEAPSGITFFLSENKIKVAGVDKELVGHVAASIRKTRPPDPYKGKGIRYLREVVKLKPGKAAKVGAQGARS